VRTLVFGCHPDDIEFQCAGTLALLAEAGHEIHMAVMAGGEAGLVTLRPAEIRAKRLKEAAAAAEVIGANFHYAGGCDLEVEYNSFYRKIATKIIRDVQPDIVLTCPPQDYLADHEMTSLLVRNACFIAPVMNYDCGGGEPTKKVPYLYYWSPLGQTDIYGREFPFQFGVDIASKMDMKIRMLCCHDSQGAWLQHMNGWDEYTHNMVEASKTIGKIFVAENAEGFVQHLGCGYPQDNILKQLLDKHFLTIKE
jgi:LmbE family N-acetylglucosaminyl deacetylase